MLITPLPGRDRESLRSALADVQQQIANPRTGRPRTQWSGPSVTSEDRQ